MKKQKIVITGGLGYIGSALCQIYSGEARYKDIVVIDNRFTSARVKQLSTWGIRFIQGNILDESVIKTTLNGADIVYHLAGVTDVAYTKTQSTDEKDKEILEYGVTGTRNIIKHIPKDCKLIFPSTHVVYEGLENTVFNLSENEPTQPKLTYAKGKVTSEEDITKSGIDYIIVRLGSVYGLSDTDTMRINIMPNLFSKITAQKGTINLFSGGVQYKSLVALQDVARAMKYLAESEIKNELYHLSNENMTCAEVAEICKSIRYVNITSTDDEIPNLGYTLSNEKLLSTGFRFRYNIHTCIIEMIEAWSIQGEMGLECILKGDKGYKDDRGSILNYELPEPVNLIGWIASKKGTVRANHYHPIQQQKCLLISGKYVSVTLDLADPQAVIETRLIKAGDLAVIQPNVAHTMVFLEDSVFLNLVNGEREHENYGITHTIPYNLVNHQLKEDLLNHYKTNCRVCGSDDLQDSLSLGMSPLANNLLNDNEDPHLYPLEWKYCPHCCNVQLSLVAPPKEMFDNYLYVSSTSSTFRKHFEDAADKYINEFNLGKNSLVVDIGSNDGVFLKPLIDKGIKAVGVEPAKNISEIANKKGIYTINSYFDSTTAQQITRKWGLADVVTASNVFAHADDLKGIAKNAMSLLSESGVFIIEVQYLINTLHDLTFDNIYHEHTNYWCVTSLVNFFDRLGYCLVKVEHINTHGGSIRVYVKKSGVPDESVKKYLLAEEPVKSIDIFKEFSRKVRHAKENVMTNMLTLADRYSVAAYGSPAKATTALNYYGGSEIKYTIEDNELKQGKIIPGVGITIVSKEHVKENLPDIIIVLAWNFFEDIKNSNRELIEKGVKFLSIKDLEAEPQTFIHALT